MRQRQLQLRTSRTNNRLKPSAVSDIGSTLERKWFDFDRNTVLRQIDLLQEAIAKNAGELGMVAVEGVFEKLLSERLLHTSRSLDGIASQLTALRNSIAKTNGTFAVRKEAV